MTISARNKFSLLVAFLWALADRRWLALPADEVPVRPAILSRFCFSHSVHRFDRSEEFISLFPLFRWRQVPCARDNIRERPPDTVLLPAIAIQILSTGAHSGANGSKTVVYLPS
jgi:hypothetical protein